MRKIIFLSLLGYVLGIIAADFFCNEKIIIPFILLCLIVSLVSLWKNISSFGIFLSVFLVFGMTAYYFQDHSHISKVAQLNKYRSSVTVKVCNNPTIKDGEASFWADAKIKGKDVAKINMTVAGQESEHIKYGDVFLIEDFSVTLPKEGYNEGEMSYRTYHKAHGISGLVYSSTGKLKYVKNESNVIIENIYKLSNYTKETLYNIIGGDEGAFAVALITGDEKYLSQEAILNIEVSGLSHIIAVSGMHMGIFVMLVGFLFSTNRRRSYAAATLNIVLCIFMIVFTGGSYSVIRAAMMVILANIGYFMGRGTYSMNSVLCVGGIIVLINPFAVFDMSFVLSFVATLSIILFDERMSEFLERKLRIKNKFINGIISVTLSAQILIIPVIVSMKNTINTYALISNILVSPLIPFSMLCVILTVVLSKINFICSGLELMCKIIIGYILKVAYFVSEIPFAQIIVSDFMFFVVIIFSLVIFILHLIARKNAVKVSGKLVLIYSVVIFFCMGLCVLYPKTVEINFINVGQGDSTLIMDKGVNVLIDSGGSNNIESDFGNRVVGSYLRTKGVSEIDYAFISHFDTDHCQGMISLFNRFEIKKLIVPRPVNKEDVSLHNIILNKANANGTKIIYATYGDEFFLNKESSIKVVAPKNYEGTNSNDNSLMLMYNSENIKTLFAGDCEREEMLRTIDADADILKVGHHGSINSTSPAFLKKVSPYVSVISVGKDNSYGLPDKEVINMHYDKGIKIFRTDFNGTVTITLNNGRIAVKTIR